MQIHGFRIACGSDKAEVVRKELQVLWRSREWSAEEWQLAAAQHTAETNGKDGIGVETDITMKNHAHLWLAHHMFQGNVY